MRYSRLIYIESKDNNLFKEAKKLKERRNRTKEGKYLIEGFRLIQEAFKANMKIEHIIVNEGFEEKLNEYLDKFEINNDNICIIKRNLFTMLTCTETPQGAIAIVNNKEMTNDIKGDFYLLCDKIQDPGNLGTIIRTAHAAGVDGIILTKGTVDIYNDKVIRSTMGSVFYMPIIQDDENLSFIKTLKSDGFSLVATSLQESKDFFESDLKGKIILSVGNEGNGISDEVFALADKKVKIPMPGGAESLNVAIATSIILFEKVRQNISKI